MDELDDLDLPADLGVGETEFIKLSVRGHDAVFLEVPASYTTDERGAYQAGLFKGIEVGIFIATGEEYRVAPTAIRTRDGN
jgi:hypothetical protein